MNPSLTNRYTCCLRMSAALAHITAIAYYRQIILLICKSFCTADAEAMDEAWLFL